MGQPITAAMVEAYRQEQDCSLSEAKRALERQAKLAARAELLARFEAAKTFDELKAIVGVILSSTPL